MVMQLVEHLRDGAGGHLKRLEQPGASWRAAFLDEQTTEKRGRGRDAASRLDQPSGQRQGKPEGRALSRNTLDPHLPVVLLDDSLGDG